MLGSTLVSCGEKGGVTPDPDPDQTDFIDYAATSNVKLNLEYQGHDFFEDGIAEVDLYTAIDGDTAHFRMSGKERSELIKARFYGIDTPESTGKIQEYGKAASNFTKEKLENANKNGTIVISSPFFEYKKPETDSTGGRYLSLIWINETVEHAPITELECLNLLIVQEGFSWVKNLNEIPEYVDTFTAAEEQARTFKLNLFSGKPDPLFNYGDYVDVSLLDLKKEIVKSLKDPTYKNIYDGENIRIQGTVAGFVKNMLYLQGHFDEETGADPNNPEEEYGGINIFCGMNSIPTKYTKQNSYVQLCGVAQDSENFGFQVAGVYSFPRTDPKNENDGQVVYTPEEIPDEYKLHTFEYEPTELQQEQFECLFSPVTLTDEVVVTGGYDGDDSITLFIETVDGQSLDYNVYIPFVYRPDLDDPTVSYRTFEDFVGQRFNVQNAIYGFHKQKKDGDIVYQLIPSGNESFTLAI